MFKDFQLAALTKQHGEWRLLQIPLHQGLQNALARDWYGQYKDFVDDATEITFDAAYAPEKGELFRVKDYPAPQWLARGAIGKTRGLDRITNDESAFESIRAIIAFVRETHGDDLMLAQTFTRSRVIKPGRFLFLRHDTYETPDHNGLTLGNHLTAVYHLRSRKLLFDNFRTTNTFLPLTDVIAEASDQDIRQVLGHNLFAAEDIEHSTSTANQWSRKRFAMLKASNILDDYTVPQLARRSKSYGVALKVAKGRIVFPADKIAARRLLQFLNEEIFRGAITEKLYETNSKRAADS